MPPAGGEPVVEPLLDLVRAVAGGVDATLACSMPGLILSTPRLRGVHAAGGWSGSFRLHRVRDLAADGVDAARERRGVLDTADAGLELGDAVVQRLGLRRELPDAAVQLGQAVVDLLQAGLHLLQPPEQLRRLGRRLVQTVLELTGAVVDLVGAGLGLPGLVGQQRAPVTDLPGPGRQGVGAGLELARAVGELRRPVPGGDRTAGELGGSGLELAGARGQGVRTRRGLTGQAVVELVGAVLQLEQTGEQLAARRAAGARCRRSAGRPPVSSTPFSRRPCSCPRRP